MRISASLAALMLLAGCTASAGPYAYPEPIPGSITYNGQPRTKLTRSPIGSTFQHEFSDRPGRFVTETYRIEPDRSLQLIRRSVVIDFER